MRSSSKFDLQLAGMAWTLLTSEDGAAGRSIVSWTVIRYTFWFGYVDMIHFKCELKPKHVISKTLV